MKLAFLLVFIAGCGRFDTGLPRPFVKCVSPKTDLQAAPYVDEFYSKARDYGSPCRLVPRIEVTDEDVSVRGDYAPIASADPDGYILIERSVFESNIPEFLKKFIVFHELGHAALDLRHSAPGSMNMMSPYIPGIAQIESDWEIIEEKLFNRNLD